MLTVHWSNCIFQYVSENWLRKRRRKGKQSHIECVKCFLPMGNADDSSAVRDMYSINYQVEAPC